MSTDRLNMPRLPFYMDVEGTRLELQQMLERFPQPLPPDEQAPAAIKRVMLSSAGLGQRHHSALHRFLVNLGAYCATVGDVDAPAHLMHGYHRNGWKPSEEAEASGDPCMHIIGGSFAERRLSAAAPFMLKALRELVAQVELAQQDDREIDLADARAALQNASGA